MQNCMYTAQGHLVCMESFIDVTNTNVMSESMNAFNVTNAANVMNSANTMPAMNTNATNATNANAANVNVANAVKTNPLGVMSESIQSQSINCSTFKYASGCDNQAGCKWNSTDSVCRPDCLHISADACGNYPACVIKTTQTCAFNA